MKFDIICRLQEQVKKKHGNTTLKKRKEFSKEYAMDIVVSSINTLYKSDKVDCQKHA